MAIVTELLVFNINRTGIIDPVLDFGNLYWWQWRI